MAVNVVRGAARVLSPVLAWAGMMAMLLFVALAFITLMAIAKGYSMHLRVGGAAMLVDPPCADDASESSP